MVQLVGIREALFELVSKRPASDLYTERYQTGQEDFLGILRFGLATTWKEGAGAYEVGYKVTTDQDTLVNPIITATSNLSGDFRTDS